MSGELERVDDGDEEELEPELRDYFEDVDPRDVAERVLLAMMTFSLLLESLEARGAVPAFTRACRLMVPRLDPYTVRRVDGERAG